MIWYFNLYFNCIYILTLISDNTFFYYLLWKFIDAKRIRFVIHEWEALDFYAGIKFCGWPSLRSKQKTSHRYLVKFRIPYCRSVPLKKVNTHNNNRSLPPIILHRRVPQYLREETFAGIGIYFSQEINFATQRLTKYLRELCKFKKRFFLQVHNK